MNNEWVLMMLIILFHHLFTMFDTKQALSNFEKLDHQQKVNKLIWVTQKLKNIPSFQDIHEYLTLAKDPIIDEVLVGYYGIILWMITTMQADKLADAQATSDETKKISASAKQAQEQDILEAEKMIEKIE